MNCVRETDRCNLVTTVFVEQSVLMYTEDPRKSHGQIFVIIIDIFVVIDHHLLLSISSSSYY